MAAMASTIITSLAAVLLALNTFLSIRSGRILWYPALIEVDRDGQPGLFWALVAAQVVAAVVLGWLSFS